MTTREPFSMGLQKNAVPSQPVIQNMRLAFSPDGAAVYKPVSGTSPPYQSSGGEASTGGAIIPHGLNMNMGSEPLKRKRGRPRKYGPDGTMALALSPTSGLNVSQSGGGFSSPPATAGSASPSSLKKARGRPPGSSKKQQMEALGNPYFPFILLGLSLFILLVQCFTNWNVLLTGCLILACSTGNSCFNLFQ